MCSVIYEGEAGSKNALNEKEFRNRRKKATVSPVLSIAPENSMMIVQVLHFDKCRVCTVHLKVGCRVDGASVVVLVQCVLEGGVAARAGSLLARTAADSGTTHEIILVAVLLIALLLDSPEDQAEGTNQDGTADTDHDTDDDLLVGGRHAARAGALVAVQRGGAGFGSGGGGGGHDVGNGGAIAGRVGGDRLHDWGLGGGWCRGSAAAIGARGRSGSFGRGG